MNPQIQQINAQLSVWASKFLQNKYVCAYDDQEQDMELLYKDIVQYGKEFPYNRDFRSQIGDLEEKFKKDYKSVFFNGSTYWIYVQALQSREQQIFERIKIYINPPKKVVQTLFLKILNQMFENKIDFFAKIALVERADSIILWVLPADLERVQTGVLELCQAYSLNAPLLLPRHLQLGISRELSSSYNEFITTRLLEFFGSKPQIVDLQHFRQYLEDNPADLDDYSTFDQKIVIQSLKLIESGESPLDTIHGIAHIPKEEDWARSN